MGKYGPRGMGPGNAKWRRGVEFPLASLSPSYTHMELAKKTLAFDSLSFLMATFADVQRNAHTDGDMIPLQLL